MRPTKDSDERAFLEAMGARLQQAREAWGLRQEDIARIAGVSRQAVAGWETGNYEPGFMRLSRIANNLCVTTDWVLTGKGDAPAISPDKAMLRRMHRAIQERLDATP